jgi:hypothetical protein
MDLNLDDESQAEMTHNPEFKALDAPPLQSGEQSCSKIRRFNRNSVWLATGILSALISAALMLAVQERQAKATDEAASGGALVNANC